MAFADFINDPYTRKVGVLEIDLWDPAAETSTTYYYATGAFTTSPSDSPANQYCPGRILRAPEVTRALFSGDALTGKSIPSIAGFELANADGGLDFIEENSLSISGQAVTYKVGDPDGDYSDFGVLWTGVGHRLEPSANGKTYVGQLRGEEQLLEVPLQTVTYKGTGQALDFESSDAGDRVVISHDASLDPSTSVCVEALYTPESLGASQYLASKDECYRLEVLSGNTVRFSVWDSTGPTIQSATSTSTLSTGQEYRLSGKWDGSEIKVLIDGVVDGTPTSYSGTINTNTNDLLFGDSTNEVDGVLDDVRIWIDTVRTDAEILANAHKELAANDDTGLAAYHKMNTNSGSTSVDETSNGNDGVVAGPDWVSAYEGESPASGGGLTGKPKPVCFGECYGVPAVLIDAKNLIYQVHSRTIQAIDAVYEGGNELTLTTDYTVDTSTGTFTLVSAPTLPITADVRGDAVGGYVSTVSDIIERICTDFVGLTAGQINSTALAALETDNGATVGYFRGAETVLASGVVTQLAQSIGASWGFERTSGKLTAVRLERQTSGGSADLDITEREILSISRRNASLPVTEQDVLYRRNWRPLQLSEVAGAVLTGSTPEFLDFLTSEWRTASATPDADRAEDYPTALPGAPIESLLVNEKDAREEAQRVYDDIRGGSEFFDVRVKLQPAQLELHDEEVDLTDSDFPTVANTGRCRPISIREGGNDFETRLTLWRAS